ncbi:uncharacterized protein MYCFIDRAFT_147469 [Pseudocercospora fijiensis CIRAD86]|uniref:ribonuclease H n=1 Tax=Pseudocercospora fijiensis (strain CIRAD86) TaxID=383855 RepID=M2ZCV9_PSEFD|nr:uncharacterized protein MYCFIDRAFT_147469 [Pseudocercospora fijiensis CIRAD86]EME76954.1 hypothetical protein MYCFIDRAFT_147469 [Pseudocercospora fijiensis CIRAD86]
MRCHDKAFRFVRRTNDREVLVYVDGSCLGQNSPTRRAGCGWTYKPGTTTSEPESYAIRLEGKGPDGDAYSQTSNRAELRAALGALEFRMWPGEGWRRMVIATDSEYVFLGITMRIQTWAARGWRTAGGQAVKNQDLWKRLLDRINYFAKYGLEVVFWKIPREQNQYADLAAKKGAREPDVEEFTKYEGVLR